MKLIDRYILRIFAGAMAATVIFMMGLYFILHFLAHVKHQADATVSFGANGYSLFSGLCRYYYVHMPEVGAMFGPYAILFAAMFTLHQLNQNNELVPIFAVGVSQFRVAVPIILASLALSGCLLLLREVVIPHHAREMVLISRMMRGKDNPKFDKLDLIGDARGNVFEAKEYDGTKLRLLNVWMLPNDQTELVSFEYLEWNDNEAQFRPSPADSMTTSEFAEISDLSIYDIHDERRVTRRSSYAQLNEQCERDPNNHQLAVMKHEHISYAFIPLVLLLLGLPLVLRGREKSVFLGLSICLALSLSFFTLNLALQRLGSKTENFSPAAAAWLPLILFGSLGLFFFEKGRR
ncbi:MAG: lipopolysaccharide export LptBFGC system permease protein LptF [Planctomycetota bacterium]|jgi:lipopolysaccharide export LptBFGC system permease protein LptF